MQQLEKGKLYYIEALHSNYINNDHVRIHIKYPGSNTSTPLDIEDLFLYSPGKLDLCLLMKHFHLQIILLHSIMEFDNFTPCWTAPQGLNKFG